MKAIRVHSPGGPESLGYKDPQVLSWITEGRLELRIGTEFPLAQAAEAHRAVEGRKLTGKVLLIP